MTFSITRRAAIALGLSFAMATTSAHAASAEDTLLIELDSGTVEIELATEIAPQHVARLKELTREGFYDGVVFHRVIEDFMAQTGDPTGTGMGGSQKPDLPAELSNVRFERGTVGMARSQSYDSANSQFFIMFDEGSFLNGEYTVVGQVVSGMEYVDAIKKGDSAANGVVQDPDKMLKVQVAADAK